MLVAGGHLERYPIVVVADSLHLSITTVSGPAAANLEEDLEAVPGGAPARTWTVHLPTPDPVGEAVQAVVAGQAHLSAQEPAAYGGTKTLARNGTAIDLDALAQREPDR
jgi:hypothetical protein